MPELPRARRRRFVARYGVSAQDAETLVGSRELADYFERTVGHGVAARLAANWVTGEVLRWMKERKVSIEEALSFPVGPERLAALLGLVESGGVSTASAKEVLAAMMDSPESPGAIVERKGLSSLRDSGAVEAAIAEVLAANPSQRALYKSGKTQTFGWFFGQVMKKTGGRADPAAVKKILTDELDKPS